MNHRLIPLAIFLVSLAVRLVTYAAYLHEPYTADSAYYFLIGRNLIEGKGLVQNFLWHYITKPEQLPCPSNDYWLPMASFAAQLGMAVGKTTYSFAQIPFVFLSSCLPVISFHAGKKLLGNPAVGFWAAWLTLWCMPFFTLWVSVENFALFGILGSLSIYFSCLATKDQSVKYCFYSGLLAGIAGWCRNDAVILALGIVSGILFSSMSPFKKRTSFSIAFLNAFLLALAPWLLRNAIIFGTPNPLGFKPFFLQDLTDLHIFNTAKLSLSGYLQPGADVIFLQKVKGLGYVLRVLLTVSLGAFLPFFVVGMYTQNSHTNIFKITFAVWLSLMGIAFSAISIAAAYRSFPAFMPFFYCFTVHGIHKVISFMPRWNQERAFTHMLTLFLCFSVAACFWHFAMEKQAYAEYIYANKKAAGWVKTHLKPNSTLMVSVDAATFHYFSGFPCITLPYDGGENVLKAARKYRTDYVVEADYFYAFHGFNIPEPLAKQPIVRRHLAEIHKEPLFRVYRFTSL